MSTLISMVGQQPAAVATTATTLLKRAGLQQVILLPTRETETECARVEDYLVKHLHIKPEGVAFCIISTDTAPPTKDGCELAWDAVRKLLEMGGLSQPVYFDVSPGLNYQVALTSHHLKGDDRFQALYADNRKLHNLTNGNAWDLEHIGFKALLDLYGLREKNGQEPSASEPGGMVDDVVLIGGRQEIVLVCACERYGRFYGLHKIWMQTGLSGEDAKSEAKRILKEGRSIESLEESPEILNHLRPDITVWSNDGNLRYRLLASGINVIGYNREVPTEAKKLFRESLNANPGSDIIETPVVFTDPPPKNINGIWTGRNLIVALGSDPSATLKAIFTHQPQKLILLVDQENPWICVLAERIRKQAHNIPAQQIIFLPTDIMGRDMNALHTHLGEENWALNISPGSKAQSWQMACLRVHGIWSLYEQQQKAIQLIGTAITPQIPYDFPPIFVQASVVGGPLSTTDKGVSKEKLIDKKDFLVAMSKVLPKAIDHKTGWPDQNKWPRGLEWAPGVSIKHDDNNYIKCLQVCPKSKKIEFEVCLHGSKQQGMVRGLAEGGLWFEEVVAGAFLNAAGSDLRDIHVGVKWEWIHKRPDGKHFRNELDVVLLWKGYYIGVSCKTGINQKDLEKELTNVIAVTRTGLGRFALPVMARSGIKPKDAKGKAERTLRMTPMELGISLFSDKSLLNILMVKLLATRRTT